MNFEVNMFDIMGSLGAMFDSIEIGIENECENVSENVSESGRENECENESENKFENEHGDKSENKHDDESENSRFVYFIDKTRIWTEPGGCVLGNITPDYGVFIKYGLTSMRYDSPQSKFERDQNRTIEMILNFINRIIYIISKTAHANSAEKAAWFERMKDAPAESFCEGIQRILFLNQLIWQTNHRLIGLGHWDRLLSDLYMRDLRSGNLTKDKAFDCVCEVLNLFHKDYYYKSNVLLGDTGQVIVVGASDEDGEYICNDLTRLIMEAVALLGLPDPKVLLRVNGKTPRGLLCAALDCMNTGCGSPLISNDEAVIPRLKAFGIRPRDALNYTVSACWEPLIGGKDSSLNNVTSLNFLRTLDNVFRRDDLSKIATFDEFKGRYFRYLAWNLNAIKRIISLQRFQYDPVLSLFMGGCRESGKDLAHGGASYHDSGMTSVALANAVNALLNIKERVFDGREMSLYDVKTCLDSDFNGREELRKSLVRESVAFGNDDGKASALVNEIMEFVSINTRDFRNHLGGRLKFGLSAPTYIDAAKGFPASFDGRHKDAPFSVHISSENFSAYTELLNFAAALDYGENRFNGNVVDLMATPDFIRQQREKFIDMLYAGINKSFFQLQMNVVGSETLIAAKQNPQAYPNLIVRVWGFSAYLIDLPEDYKDYLIARALANENR